MRIKFPGSKEKNCPRGRKVKRRNTGPKSRNVSQVFFRKNLLVKKITKYRIKSSSASIKKYGRKGTAIPGRRPPRRSAHLRSGWRASEGSSRPPPPFWRPSPLGPARSHESEIPPPPGLIGQAPLLMSTHETALIFLDPVGPPDNPYYPFLIPRVPNYLPKPSPNTADISPLFSQDLIASISIRVE